MCVSAFVSERRGGDETRHEKEENKGQAGIRGCTVQVQQRVQALVHCLHNRVDVKHMLLVDVHQHWGSDPLVLAGEEAG